MMINDKGGFRMVLLRLDTTYAQGTEFKPLLLLLEIQRVKFGSNERSPESHCVVLLEGW